MTLTYRELIKQLHDMTVEHGDYILDLPAKAMTAGEDVHITDVTYHPAEAETEEHEGEPEAIYMGTNWI